MKRRYVFAGLALVAALTVASTALGGPSLKKLVKKEVAKQLAGKTGPQGPQGAEGTARAYASVGQGSLCNQAPTGSDCPIVDAKGITAVTRVSTGTFCVAAPGISPDATAPVASEEANSTGAGSYGVLIDRLHPHCTGANAGRFEVDTVTSSPAGLSNLVGFNIVIP